ncbi:hypothetical protein K1719_024708 [Acacia pycnantha]|nr:hypothetical protein K1719_024708 [Acacia pycnantha]
MTYSPFSCWYEDDCAGPCYCSMPKYFVYSQFSHRKRIVALTTKRNASVLPKIRAQSSLCYFPDSNFYKVEAILRPWRIPHVSSALLKMGIRGVTVSDVKGFGAQGGSKERQGVKIKSF